jgi:peptidoglycan/xylan/chitin deacetylase (PgdA/CDA1 family)
MAGGLTIGGKRELLARGLLWSGASLLLSQLPARDCLLVLNYHRIGNAEDDLFDPGVFSATADEFDYQIAYLKRRLSLVTLEEALAYIDGTEKKKTHRCRVLMTFDDGYLDNYKIAYPILRLHGVQGVFFLATSMVGSCEIPWWDRIAYLVKTAQKRRFSLSYPAKLAIDIDKNGLPKSLNTILKAYKQPYNYDPARFVGELAEESKGDDPPETTRRFLNWDEAREMSKSGMEIGSHTDSHTVLSRLEPERQREELAKSRAILLEQLGTEAKALAYPVGHKDSFSNQTQIIAQETGYRCAFSHHGGINIQGKTCVYNVKRNKVARQSLNRFQIEVSISSAINIFWP